MNKKVIIIIVIVLLVIAISFFIYQRNKRVYKEEADKLITEYKNLVINDFSAALPDEELLRVKYIYDKLKKAGYKIKLIYYADKVDINIDYPSYY